MLCVDGICLCFGMLTTSPDPAQIIILSLTLSVHRGRWEHDAALQVCRTYD